LGQPVNLITAVGEDDAGERLLETLMEAGVNVQAVLRSSEEDTGSYLAVINQSGALQLALYDMRIVSALTPEYIHRHASLFDQASLLFLDANLPKDVCAPSCLSLAGTTCRFVPIPRQPAWPIACALTCRACLSALPTVVKRRCYVKRISR
jgi:pseudouridine kinase